MVVCGSSNDIPTDFFVRFSVLIFIDLIFALFDYSMLASSSWSQASCYTSMWNNAHFMPTQEWFNITRENDRPLRGKERYKFGRPRWLLQKPHVRIHRINSREISVPLEDNFTERQTSWEIFLNVYRADNILELLPYHASMFFVEAPSADPEPCSQKIDFQGKHARQLNGLDQNSFLPG